MAFLLSLDEVERVDVSLPEQLIFEKHVMLFLIEFIHFAESVHVQLTDERLNLPVPEVDRKHFFLESFGVFDVNLTIVLGPANNILKFIFLS